MLETLRKIITMYAEIDPGEITPESDIRNDLGLNSLTLMNLIVEVEDRYNIEIPEEAAIEFETVGDVIAYLEKNVK